MPKSPRISRNMIVEAAFDLVRTDGAAALNARAVAARLGCSTQPVLYQFADMAALRRAVYDRADAFHTNFLLEDLEQAEEPLTELGLRYIRFGAEEAPLFRFLFQDDHFSGRSLEELIAAPEVAPLLALAGGALGASGGDAGELFGTLFIAVHGYASLLANNAMRYDPEDARRMLVRLGSALEAREGE